LIFADGYGIIGSVNGAMRFSCVASAAHFFILQKEGITMEPWMVILGIVALVVGIMVARYIANCFYEIACMKGFHDRCYFWIPFLLGIVGYLLVVALPDRKQEKTTPAKPTKPLFSPQGTQKPVGRWACPDCDNVLPGDVIQCKCGYRRTKGNDTPPTATKPTGKWVCPDCGNSHPGEVEQCECGYKR